MARQKKQTGSRKEAQPGIVSSVVLGSEELHEKILTPEDAEYHRYSELLKGFFEKIIRWQEILKAKEYIEKSYDYWQKDNIRGFSVFLSDNGPTIIPGNTMESNDPPNKILQMRSIIGLNHPEQGEYQEKFIIRPGRVAGKNLLVDPDGKQLQAVEIEVGIQPHASLKFITISTERVREEHEPGSSSSDRQAAYSLVGHTLEVSHQESWYGVITDEIAASLIDTIDALIPGATPPTQQYGRRESGELQTAKALPQARRTRPPG